MTVKCPYCGKTDVEVFGDPCVECGQVADIRDVVRPIAELLEQLVRCPVCSAKAFDGVHCYQCTNTISDKAKKAHVCVVIGQKESESLAEHFKQVFLE